MLPASPKRTFTVTVADDDVRSGLGEPPPGVRWRRWDLSASLPDAADVEVVVPPYLMSTTSWAGSLGELLGELPRLRLVQLLTAGYDSVLPAVPDGVALARAVGVHDDSTAELALALTLAALRGLPDFVRDAAEGRWRDQRYPSLADRRALVVGFGGVGRAVARRLAPFETEVTAVASRSRPPTEADRQCGVTRVHGVEKLLELLPRQDVVLLTVPLSAATRGLVDAAFLAAMPDGALLVNVARGPVVDTAALLAEVRAGRLLAAVDVTDPEPLPPDHPLWTTPGALVSPHVGGNSTAFRSRAVRLLHDQCERLAQDRPVRGLVVPGALPDLRDRAGRSSGGPGSSSMWPALDSGS